MASDAQQQRINFYRQLACAIDETDFSQAFTPYFHDLGRFTGYMICLIEPEGKRQACTNISLQERYKGFEETYLKLRFSMRSNDALTVAINTRKSILYGEDDLIHYSDNTRTRFEQLGMKECVALPIVIGDDVIGSFCAYTEEGSFNNADVELLQQLVADIALPLQRCHDHSLLLEKEKLIESAEEERREFLQFITRVNDLTSATQIYSTIGEEFLKRYQFDIGLVCFLEDGKLLVKSTGYRGAENREAYERWKNHIEGYHLNIATPREASAIAFMKNHHVYFEDAASLKDLPMDPKDKDSLILLGSATTILHMPIRQGNDPVGVISMFSLNKRVVKLQNRDISSISMVCRFIGSAIRNAETYSRVEDQRNEIQHTLEQLKRAQELLVKTERQRVDAMRSAKEAAEATASAKSSFLANMSHEIRTPMNAIIGFTEVLSRSSLRADQQDHLRKIESSSRNLLGIINDILDFSKIDAGKLDLEEVDFVLEDELGNLSDMFASKLGNKNIELVVNIDEKVPATLRGDPLRVSQILINLTNNAIKFTESGEIEISVEFIGANPSMIQLQMRVRDTGIGIPADVLPNLFNPFIQADESMTRRFGGTGLGLAISRKLTEMMGGEIWVESAPQQGSTFNFTVKLKPSQITGGERDIPAELHDFRVLAVSPNDTLTRFLQRALFHFHVKHKVVSSTEEFLQGLSGNYPPNLLFIDSHLLDTADGEQLESLKNIAGSLPIIGLIPYGDDERREQLTNLGVHSILTKPLKRSDIFDILCVVSGLQQPDSLPAEDQSNDRNPKDFAGASILLVEDNPVNQDLALTLLANSQVDISVANHGREALDILAQKSIDIVLMDIQMPVMDGFEATRQIRDQKKFAGLPIIAMTANALKGDRERCLQAGMNDYIAKPINRDHLFSKLALWAPKQKDEITPVNTPAIAKASSKIPNKSLPDSLPGLDIKSALDNIGNDSALYLRVFQDVLTQYTNASKDLREALARNDIESAERISHTLKGLAATIGATDLHAAAYDLNFQLKNGELSSKEHLLVEIDSAFAHLHTLKGALGLAEHATA